MTALWCARSLASVDFEVSGRPKDARVFCSPELRYFHKAWTESERKYIGQAIWGSEAAEAAHTAQVEHRRRLVAGLSIYRQHLVEIAGGSANAYKHVGRILCYCPDETLSDGAAHALSEGFLDWDNQPPADTWIGYVPRCSRGCVGNFLLSWVPDAWVQRVEQGIEVNPEDCLWWDSTASRTVAEHVRVLAGGA